MTAPPPSEDDPPRGRTEATAPDAARDTAVLASGGRVSFGGFVLRLMARMPFLFIAGRLFGSAELGRFGYAILVVELTAQLATLGLKRGLAVELAQGAQPEPAIVADALLLGAGLAAVGAAVLIALPAIVFPGGAVTGFERLFPLIAVALALSDISLAALAFRHDIAAQVRARSVIEPWTLTIVAAGIGFGVPSLKSDGLLIAYVVSLVAAAAASLVPCVRDFGVPRGWRPAPARLVALARTNFPLAGADLAEWSSRRLDFFLLGRFASEEIVGIYFVAQNIASLPSKLKNSFDPILAPLLSTALARGDTAAAAGHVRQVAFWIISAQFAVVLALGLTARASMGLFGHDFAVGAPVLAILLLVELLASQGAVAEAALIYVRRKTNLLIGLGGLVLQAGLTFALVERYLGLAAAGALAVSVLAMSVARSRLLASVLKAPVSGWRWSLPAAGAAAFAVGFGIQQASYTLAAAHASLGLTIGRATAIGEFGELSLGLVAILGTFAAVIWWLGFKGPDRLLFQRRPT